MLARRGLTIAILCGLAVVPSAAAYVNPGYFPERNWSGYQVLAENVTMDQVSASWTQPRAHCTSAIPYSIVTPWIGIGDPIGVEPPH
jgi:hypothetical protein